MRKKSPRPELSITWLWGRKPPGRNTVLEQCDSENHSPQQGAPRPHGTEQDRYGVLQEPQAGQQTGERVDSGGKYPRTTDLAGNMGRGAADEQSPFQRSQWEKRHRFVIRRFAPVYGLRSLHAVYAGLPEEIRWARKIQDTSSGAEHHRSTTA